MQMIPRRFIAFILFAACLLPQAFARQEAKAVAFADEAAAHGRDSLPPIQTRRYSFSALDGKPSLRLLPTEEMVPITFGKRVDESVVKAVLKVRYTYSPALIPLQSHIRVRLNGAVVGVLPVTRENAGREVTQELQLDPQTIARFNSLKLEFIGHYTDECEDPLHLGLWADILRGTEIQLSTRPVALPNDLSVLPQPFFDPADSRRLDMPHVFAERPSFPSLQAAGITASWFGSLASWRRARFPVLLGTLPKGHAIVFATNTERPPFLKDLPQFGGPALSIIANPADKYSKLLLISGRDGNDLKAAAAAMVLGGTALSGARTEVMQWSEKAPRMAYDAPNWVRLDRPMRLGELVESPQQLQVYGHVPEPIRIALRIPPDLFTWRSRGVPVNLKFRYTPPIRISDSHLTMSINGEQVQIVNLRSSGLGGDSTHVTLPLLDASLLGDGRELLIPAFKLGNRNQIQYDFSFSYLSEGACRATQVENIQAMIDPDSNIDFSGYPHYAQMPHLGYFATAGFPFTKYADLGQTAVVLPPEPAAKDIEVMLTLLGRMGESTGYPATRVSVVAPDQMQALNGKDLLVIGSPDRQSLLDRWRDRLPAAAARLLNDIPKASGMKGRLHEFLGIVKKPQNHTRGNGPLAALIGFESPISPKRSVIAATAVQTDDYDVLLGALEDDSAIKLMHGGVVLVYDGKTESIAAEKTYALGKLPVWTSIWFPLSDYPILVAVMSVFAVLIFAFALWRTLKAVARRRLQE